MLLEVRKLRKQFLAKGGKRVAAVEDISFQLPAGEILAFLGPNGAGKTTTIKMMAGLIRPDDGDAWVAGHSVRKEPGRALRQLGAVLEGSRNLYWRLTPMENFEYWGGIRGVPRKVARTRGREWMGAFGLEDKLNHTVQQLSRGMQQQVAICTALIHEPALLLLDEPTLGLDLEASDRIQAIIHKLVSERSMGILLTTHQMEIAQALSHRVSIIQRGKLVVEGRTTEVLEAFSGNAYLFEVGEPLHADIRGSLTSLGAEFDSDTKFRMVLNNPDELYSILGRIAPCPLIRIERDMADLAQVFRHFTKADVGQGVFL
jgi:ABC-2 type transport system ATP-binding protein